MQSFLGPYSSIELVYNLKSFFNSLGCNNIYYIELDNNIPDFRYMYLLNNTLRDLNMINDFLIIGSNVRLESPLLNSFFRKNYLNNINFKVYIIGLGLNYLNYATINIGSSVNSINKYILGLLTVCKYFLFNDYYNLSYFYNKNLFSENILLGSSSIIRNDSNNILNLILFISIKSLIILLIKLIYIMTYNLDTLFHSLVF